MKRAILSLVGVLVLALGAYAIYYEAMTRPAETLLAKPEGKLEWLRREFGLTDTQFAKIADLHDAYGPVCGAMCERIVAANQRLEALIAANRQVTPEVEAALGEAATVRQDCNAALLRHAYAVAAEMSPENGKRYLEMTTARLTQPAPFYSAAMSRSPK